MRGFLCALAVFAVVALPVGARSAERPPALSLAALVAEAKAQNPTLLAARARAGAMAAVPPQARALDDPTLSYEAWNTPNSFRLDRADNNIFRISQRLPFPGKRGLAEAMATRTAEASGHDADALELDVVAAVKEAYYGLWQATERLAIVMREKQLVDRFTRVLTERYATGEGLQAEVLRAQVELAHFANRIQTERLEIDRARVTLAALVSAEPAALGGVPDAPSVPRLDVTTDDLLARALLTRPEVKARTAAIARAESGVQLAERNQYPDFEVSLGRFVNSDARDGFGAMVSMTLPVFNRSKYAAAVDEAKAELRAAEADRRRVEDLLRREVGEAFLRARTALAQYALFNETHLPQAEQAFRVTESAYQTGAVSFLDLLETLRSIESVHLEHLAARADFAKAYAELERVVGGELSPSVPAVPSASASPLPRQPHAHE